MKRILHVVGRMDRAGAEIMVMNLYRVIDRKKFQFDFLYFTNKKCDFDDEIISLGGRIFILDEKKYTDPISRTRELIKFLKSKNFDAIHCHMLFSNVFHLFAGYKAGIPKRIVHSHSTSNKSKGVKFIDKIYESASRFGIKKYATDYIACGIEAGKCLFPFQQSPLLLPNAIDIELFNNTAKTHQKFLRNLLNLDENCLIITQLGRLNEVKNHDFTIGLVAHLKEMDDHFHFVFVGDGPLNNTLRLQVASKGLNNHISFLGIRTEIPEILAGTDVMIMPSLYEGFPVVLVESQASGTPALISDRISKEVDLGIGLVNFLSLDDVFETWRKKMIFLGLKKNSKTEEILPAMRKKGYDINTSVKKLEKLYSYV